MGSTSLWKVTESAAQAETAERQRITQREGFMGLMIAEMKLSNPAPTHHQPNAQTTRTSNDPIRSNRPSNLRNTETGIRRRTSPTIDAITSTALRTISFSLCVAQ